MLRSVGGVERYVVGGGPPVTFATPHWALLAKSSYRRLLSSCSLAFELTMNAATRNNAAKVYSIMLSQCRERSRSGRRLSSGGAAVCFAMGVAVICTSARVGDRSGGSGMSAFTSCSTGKVNVTWHFRHLPLRPAYSSGTRST